MITFEVTIKRGEEVITHFDLPENSGIELEIGGKKVTVRNEVTKKYAQPIN